MNVAATLDDRTTAAIRQALAAASRGMLADACEIGERALANGGDVAALNAMLGVFRRQSGEIDASIAHLRTAHAARPLDPKIATNLATALSEAGERTQALAVLTDDLVLTDVSMQLARLRGFLAQAAEEHALAVSAYERVIAALPDDWEAWNNLGNARRCVGDFDGSIAALQRAAAIEPNSPPIRLNLAVAIGAAGNLAESERQLRALAAESPGETQPLRELHALLKEQLRDEEALEAIEEAVRREPDNVELRLALASHLSETLKFDAAETAYLNVIELQPSNGQANLGLAFVYELTNQTEKLFESMREADDRGVGVAGREFIRAFGLRRQKRYEEGLKALEHVPESMESPRRAHLHGQLLQGAGRHDEAFAAFERMNAITQNDVSGLEQRAAGYRSQIRQHIETLTPDFVASWQARKSDPKQAPVFLVGFPRSGTTLLDTILMSHDKVEVLEEEPTSRDAIKLIPDIASLPDLADDKIAAARAAYWQTAQSLTPLQPGTLLIDKNPLLMNGLPFIHRLFPGAKVILALRHPCDVVLSCFITNFRPNDGMSSFLNLDSAAELYDLSFRNFERAQALFNLPQHTVVYERIVADREAELRSLFDCLGLDWHERVMRHEETAKGRGRIKTASYAQVVEPIYTRAAGRWWNYRRQLEPILPILAPWVEKFGYSLDDPEKFAPGLAAQ
jgi:tetratricopeptide (TPR) repeat protein